MPKDLEQVAKEVEEGKLTKLALAQHSGLDWKTVQSALEGRRKSNRLTVRALIESAQFLLQKNMPIDSDVTHATPASSQSAAPQ